MNSISLNMSILNFNSNVEAVRSEATSPTSPFSLSRTRIISNVAHRIFGTIGNGSTDDIRPRTSTDLTSRINPSPSGEILENTIYGQPLQRQNAMRQVVVNEFQYPETINYDTIPEEFHDNVIFQQFIDPINQEPIRFPVKVANPFSKKKYDLYERKSMINWINSEIAKDRPPTNPTTRVVLVEGDIEEDLETRKIIEDEMTRLNIPL